MSEKYIDLGPRIFNTTGLDMPSKKRLASIHCVLRWLDEHPDQVPGRTITESEVDLAVAEVFGSDWRAEGPCKVLLGRLGLTVVPDPELPTEPGSVVRTRGDGEDYTLGRDLNWRYGRSVVQPADLRQLDWEVVA